MKPGWSTRKLIDVATLQRGFDLPSQDRIAGNFPLVSSSGIIDSHATQAVTAPGVVTGRSGSIGNVFFIEDDFWPLNTTLYVKDFHGNDPRFVYHLLKHFDLRQFASGTGVPTLNRNSVHEEMVMVPPLPEQQRIVAILDEAFAAIATAKANAEKNLQNAKLLFDQSLIAKFREVGQAWPVRLLGELADVQSGGTPSVANKSFWGGDIPWYSSGELNDLQTQAPERHISEAGLNGSNAKKFPAGSLLIGMYDTAALKMSLLDREAAFNQAIAGVKPSSLVNLEFVLNAINADKPRLLADRRGTRQKNLSLSKIKSIEIPFPPTAVQTETNDRVHDIRTETLRLESLYRRKLTALAELKKSLLHRAFNGDL